MFDAGFTELLLVFVIGLLILGPERLPRVAAQLGRWVAKARRTANQLRYQLEREVALDDIYKAQKKKPQKRPGAAAPGTPAGAAPASAAPESTDETTDGASAVPASAPGGATDAATVPASESEAVAVPAAAPADSFRDSPSPTASDRVEVMTEDAVENASDDGEFRQSRGSR